jgi:hypothetical protein
MTGPADVLGKTVQLHNATMMPVLEAITFEGNICFDDFLLTHVKCSNDRRCFIGASSPARRALAVTRQTGSRRPQAMPRGGSNP